VHHIIRFSPTVQTVSLKALFFLAFALLPALTQAAEQSKWDQELLGIQFTNVSIKAPNLPRAWQEIATKYLVRCNLYMDRNMDADFHAFRFVKSAASGGELLQEFVSVYPAYTYTQDPQSGIIWLHRKEIKYSEILDQKVKIECACPQARAFTDIIEPTCSILAPRLTYSPVSFASPSRYSFDYGVDLNAGIFSVKEILNQCCAANPTKAFFIVPADNGGLSIKLVNLFTSNPLLGIRPAILRYWEVHFSTPRGFQPGIAEIAKKLSDKDGKTRAIVRNYLEGTYPEYPFLQLCSGTNDLSSSACGAINMKSIFRMGRGNERFVSSFANLTGVPTNSTAQITPGLRLLVAMEIAREKSDSSVMDPALPHHFTKEEIEALMPELILIVRESRLVREKLLEAKSSFPEDLIHDLSQLGQTNLVKLIAN
jgi:hypothetical protein